MQPTPTEEPYDLVYTGRPQMWVYNYCKRGIATFARRSRFVQLGRNVDQLENSMKPQLLQMQGRDVHPLCLVELRCICKKGLNQTSPSSPASVPTPLAPSILWEPLSARPPRRGGAAGEGDARPDLAGVGRRRHVHHVTAGPRAGRHGVRPLAGPVPLLQRADNF